MSTRTSARKSAAGKKEAPTAPTTATKDVKDVKNTKSAKSTTSSRMEIDFESTATKNTPKKRRISTSRPIDSSLDEEMSAPSAAKRKGEFSVQKEVLTDDGFVARKKQKKEHATTAAAATTATTSTPASTAAAPAQPILPDHPENIRNRARLVELTELKAKAEADLAHFRREIDQLKSTLAATPKLIGAISPAEQKFLDEHRGGVVPTLLAEAYQQETVQQEAMLKKLGEVEQSLIQVREEQKVFKAHLREEAQQTQGSDPRALIAQLGQ